MGQDRPRTGVQFTGHWIEAHRSNLAEVVFTSGTLAEQYAPQWVQKGHLMHGLRVRETPIF